MKTKNFTRLLQVSLLLFLFPLTSFRATACSCAFIANTFCESVSLSEGVWIFSAKVIANYDMQITDSWSGRSLDVVILDQYYGEDIPFDTISMIGQDGLNCNAWIGDFVVGEKMLFAIGNYPGSTYPDQMEIPNFSSYDLSGCGRYYLSFSDDDMLVGPIRPGVNLMSVENFMEGLNDCLLLTDDNSPYDQDQLDIFPNPASDQVTVENRGQQKVELRLYGSQGQLVYEGVIAGGGTTFIPLRDLPAGVYWWVHLENGERAISEKLVKI